MKLYGDDGSYTPEACAYFWPNGEPSDELKEVSGYTQESWGEAMEVINLLCERWEAEQLEAMRSAETLAMVSRRLSHFTANRQATEPWLGEDEANELARLLVNDLTTPRVVVPSDERPDNPS